jgi:hypothetical protein
MGAGRLLRPQQLRRRRAQLPGGRDEEPQTDQLSPLLPNGSLAFTAHVDLALRPTDTGTDLDVHYRKEDPTMGKIFTHMTMSLDGFIADPR